MAQLNRINLVGVSQGFVGGTFHETLASEDGSHYGIVIYSFIRSTPDCNSHGIALTV